MAYEELIAVRNEVLDAIDAECARVISDAMFSALEEARLNVFHDMTSRAEDGYRLIERKWPEVLLAIVIAYDYYGDASRADAIVGRNKVAHPGFVDVGDLKLLSV